MREVKPTQKPVPSSDIKDLFFNSGLLDVWATSLERKYIDRFGNCHLTAAGMEWLFKELVEKFKVDMNIAIVAAGYITIDSFQQGADLPNNELIQRNHILRDETTGEYYRWDGDLPKQVPAGSTPKSTGGIGKGAWVSVGDASLRSDITNSGGAVIGTFHRQNLKKDLDAIDRRPDGYDNNIHAVLENGQDVEVNKDYQSATQVQLRNGQVVKGAGGSLKVTSGKQSAFRADARNATESKDGVIIDNLKTIGRVQPDSNTDSIGAYSVFLRDNAYSLINGIYSEGFTGGVALTNTRSTMVNNVRARSTVYHPDAVRGAYGVFLDECRDTIVNGVHFTANAGNDGRHLLYVSRGGGGNSYDGCVNLIATNLIARYNNKNNRDMWSFNYRKSMRTIQSNFITEGSNGGVAYNCENGNVEKNILANGHIQVLKYQNGVGVYAVNHDDRFTDKGVNGWLASNLIIEVKPKDATITGDGCIGYKIASKNGMLANIVTNVHTLGAPIYINNGASNILISNVLDYLNDGSTETAEACIVFAGDHGTMQNVTILGIKTPRKIFRRITAAVNVTVDFPRSAKVSLNAGAYTLVDEQELINRVSVGTTSISVILNDHVTQLAADSASVRMVLDGGIEGYTILRYTSNKELQIRFYNAGGTLQNPSTVSALSCLVTLYS